MADIALFAEVMAGAKLRYVLRMRNSRNKIKDHAES